MNIKKYVSFILIFAVFLFSSIGDADFLVNDNINIDENQIGNEKTSFIYLDYNDGINQKYKYLLDGETGRFNEEDGSFPEPQSYDNHSFIGWYETRSGFYSDGSSSLYNGGLLNNGDTLYAKYLNKSSASISNNLTSSLTITPSMSHNYNYYYLSSYSNNSISEELTVSNSGKININFSDSNGTYSTALEGTDKTIKYVSQAEIIAVLDSNLVIDGGTLQLSSILGGNSGVLQAQITGKFTALDLNGYNITIRNGGLLNGFGIIFNSADTGGIIVENGTINTPFLVYGYKGGGITGASWGNAVAPFTNFLCPYLSVETVFTNAATLLGETSLYARSKKHATTLKLISNSSDSLIQISTGYLIKRTTDYKKYTQDYLFNYSITDYYDALTSDYRETFVFTNEVSEYVEFIDKELVEQYRTDKCVITQNSLDLNVNVGVTLNVSMRYVDFPIPSFFDIYLYNTNLSFNISFQFMPGSYFYSDENSNIYFRKQTDGTYDYNIFAKIITFDRYPYSIQYKFKGENSTTSYSFPSGNFPNLYVSQSLAFSTEPAEIIIDGNIYFEDYENNYNDSFSFYSIGGRVNLSKQALNMVKSNSSKIMLANLGAQYIYHEDSDYGIDLAEYSTKPLISNGKAYFQMETFGEIFEGKFLEEKCIIEFNHEYYFYNFSNQNKSIKSFGILGLLGVLSSPTKNNNENKYNNLLGKFQKCSLHILNNEKNLFYISDENNQNYIYLNGAFIPISDTPSYNEKLLSVSGVTLVASNKFSTSTLGGILYGQTAYFDDLYLNEWRLNYVQ